MLPDEQRLRGLVYKESSQDSEGRKDKGQSERATYVPTRAVFSNSSQFLGLCVPGDPPVVYNSISPCCQIVLRRDNFTETLSVSCFPSRSFGCEQRWITVMEGSITCSMMKREKDNRKQKWGYERESGGDKMLIIYKAKVRKQPKCPLIDKWYGIFSHS